MSDFHVLVKKSSVTSALRSLAFHDVDCEYLVFTSANKTSALSILNSIGKDNSIHSDTEIIATGDQTNGIMVPKSAGK